MAQQPPTPITAKVKVIDKSRSLTLKARHRSLPGAFSDDELAWFLTGPVEYGSPTGKDEAAACSADQPKGEESPVTIDEARTVQDQEGVNYDPIQGAGCPRTEDLVALVEDLSAIESHMRQIGEMESGHSTVLGAGSKLRIYGEDQACAVELWSLVKDSPELDHLDRLRALEEATLW